MKALARPLLPIAATVLALGIWSLAPVPANAGSEAAAPIVSLPSATSTTVTALEVSNVANPAVTGQLGYDPYALRSSYVFTAHNCPPENCGTVDQCGFLPPGTTCGTLPGCTCKKCHNWGVCTR